MPKSYSTSHNGIGDNKKKKKLIKVKPQHWLILIVSKRSNKIKVVKTCAALKILCHWQSQISELLHFENKFRVTIYLLWLGFTPFKAKQLLRGMELKEKITQKRLYTGYRKSV